MSVIRARTAPAAALLALAVTALAAPGCASKNVPADRIVYAVHEGPPPPIPFAPLAASAPAQRADEATVRAWWDSHRPAQGYVPAYDDSAAQMAAEEARSCGSGWWPGIGLGIGLGFGWGSGGCGDGWGVGLSVGLPLGFYVW